jgi:hypothetical protein
VRGVALIHRATIVPTKIDLLRQWVPLQPWAAGIDAGTLEVVDAYRFDDPDGEVGLESHLLRAADGAIVHVPLTYRSAPLPGAETALITTMEHSVLGTRHVHDAAHDPVYLATLLRTVLTGGTQAAFEYAEPGPEREVTALVHGTGQAGADVPDVHAPSVYTRGTDTVVDVGTAVLTLHRVPLDDPADRDALVGTWAGRAHPAVLATAVLHGTAHGG